MSVDETGADAQSVAFDYSPEELERVSRAWSERGLSPLGAWAARHAATAVVVVFGAVIVLMLRWAGAVIVLLGGVYLFAGRRARIAATVTAQARARGLASMFEVRLQPASLLLRSPGGDIAAPWRAVSLQEHDGNVILELPGARIPIPSRAFADEAARREFVAVVRARSAGTVPAVEVAAGHVGGVTLELTRGDHYAAALLGPRSTPLILLVGGLLMSMYATMLVFEVWTLEMAICLLGSALLPLAAPFAPALALAEIAWQEGRAAGSTTVGLTEEGVWYAGDTVVTVPWTQVDALRTVGRGLLLREGHQWRVVPRRAFADAAAFRVFAGEAERLWRRGRGGLNARSG